MNRQIFNHLAEQAYNEVVAQNNDFPYSLDDVLSVFDYFFSQYELNMGVEHPPLKRQQIKKHILSMPFADDGYGHFPDIAPEQYQDIIEAYFDTRFKNCDYRIAHFFSGDIRILRLYEIGY